MSTVFGVHRTSSNLLEPYHCRDSKVCRVLPGCIAGVKGEGEKDNVNPMEYVINIVKKKQNAILIKHNTA